MVDRISRETPYQGTAAVAPDRTYALGIPLPAGSYDLRVDGVTRTGQLTESYGRTVEVT